MITISIIALIIAVVALVVVLSVRSVVRKFNNTLITIQREQASISNIVRGVELRVDDLEDEIRD